MKPVALVVAAPGTNREAEAAFALEQAGASARIVPVAAVSDMLDDARMLVLAGGFSFGDELGSGRLFALELRLELGDRLAEFVSRGRPVLGICNGFQALVRTGLLPGALGHNGGGHFECRWVHLAPTAARCIWTDGLAEPLFAPVAHGEGRYVATDESIAALRYSDAAGGAAKGEYPANPNRSDDDIAGVTDATGLVLGLMPHPEDHVLVRQHPRRTRGQTFGNSLALFRNGVRHAMELT